MSNIAKRDDDAGGWGEIEKHNATRDNPLMLVPADMRRPLSVLWMANAHLLPSALALCATVRVYIGGQGLTEPELSAIVRRLLTPQRRERHKFASDLIADLSRLVAQAVESRRAADETAARRETFAAPPGWVAAKDLFQPPKE